METKRTNIICATDFSDLATRTATAAAALAIRAKHTLVLVHVHEPSGLESNETFPLLEKPCVGRRSGNGKKQRPVLIVRPDKF